MKLVNSCYLQVARNNEGSQCNQAIMLITDGAPYTYEKIFQQYNWPNIPVIFQHIILNIFNILDGSIIDVFSHLQVRVFTYLIGREVTDMDEVQWMACYNRGNFCV